jgi:hypothetical protein
MLTAFDSPRPEIKRLTALFALDRLRAFANFSSMYSFQKEKQQKIDRSNVLLKTSKIN